MLPVESRETTVCSMQQSTGNNNGDSNSNLSTNNKIKQPEKRKLSIHLVRRVVKQTISDRIAIFEAISANRPTFRKLARENQAQQQDTEKKATESVQAAAQTPNHLHHVFLPELHLTYWRSRN